MLKWLRRDQKEPPAASLGSLSVVQPWMCASATSPWTAGCFMTLVNEGDVDCLLSAHSEVAGWTEVCGIKVVGAELKMAYLEFGLRLPANGTIILKPRGYHLLMMGLASPLVVGSHVPMTLYFRKAGALDIACKVAPPAVVGGYTLDRAHVPG